jgi:hypothetical protein
MNELGIAFVETHQYRVNGNKKINCNLHSDSTDVIHMRFLKKMHEYV